MTNLRRPHHVVVRSNGVAGVLSRHGECPTLPDRIEIAAETYSSPAHSDANIERTRVPASKIVSHDWSSTNVMDAVVRRARITTATLGEWNVHLNCREQFLPINAAVPSFELFFQEIMGKTSSYALTGQPELMERAFIKRALVLSFKSLRGGRDNSIPWSLMTVFAQFLMRRAQFGITDRFIGEIWGGNGVVVQVAIVTAVGHAAGQAVLDRGDSASEIQMPGYQT